MSFETMTVKPAPDAVERHRHLRLHGSGLGGTKAMVADEETERDELEAQLETAMEGLRRTVVRLLQGGEVHPHLVVLALARVTGEVGVSTALAGEQDPEELLGDLADAMRQAGREFQETLRAEALPTAGNA